jgi:hypothetical protein
MTGYMYCKGGSGTSDGAGGSGGRVNVVFHTGRYESDHVISQCFLILLSKKSKDSLNKLNLICHKENKTLFQIFPFFFFKNYLHWDFSKFGLYRFPVYTGFGSDMFHCVTVFKLT